MTDRLVKPKELRELGVKDQVNLLVNRLNLDSTQVELIQGLSDTESIIEAGIIVYKGIRELGHSKKLALSHISGSMLSPIISNNNNYDMGKEFTQNEIWYSFRDEVKEFYIEHEVELNSPTMLRREIYQRVEGKELAANIIATKKIWGKQIEFSDLDLLKGIKIKPINLEHAILLGISTLGLGLNHNYSKSHFEATYTIGQEQEKAMFGEIAIPIMQENFNVLTNGDSVRKEDRRIRIHSQLIHSYFKHGLRFSDTLNNRQLVDFNKIPKAALDEEITNIEKAYMIGLMAKKLRVSQQGSVGKQFYQADINLRQNARLLGQIKELAKQLGYETTISTKTPRLKFGKYSFPLLIQDKFIDKQNIGYKHKGLLINPYQIGKF